MGVGDDLDVSRACEAFLEHDREFVADEFLPGHKCGPPPLTATRLLGVRMMSKPIPDRRPPVILTRQYLGRHETDTASTAVPGVGRAAGTRIWGGAFGDRLLVDLRPALVG